MPIKILSLVPAATEIVYLLGLGDSLIGISHECDFPKKVKNKKKVTSSLINNRFSSKEINQKIIASKHRGLSLFHIEADILNDLGPDLILTQELCSVCAISYTEVRKTFKILDNQNFLGSNTKTKIISLEPESIDEIFKNIRLVGRLTERSKEAKAQITKMRDRLKKPCFKLENTKQAKPKALIIEWLDPLMAAGHWVPNMIEKAGGIALITKNGDKSYPINIDQIIKSNPSIIIFAPCGFDIKRTLMEKKLIKKIMKSFVKLKCKIFIMDANAYLTRPGPRVIDGVEILSQIFYPEIFPRSYKKSDWLEFL